MLPKRARTKSPSDVAVKCDVPESLGKTTRNTPMNPSTRPITCFLVKGSLNNRIAIRETSTGCILVITEDKPAGAPKLMAYQTPAKYIPCRVMPIASEAKKSARESFKGARKISANRKRMSAARSNLMARK